MVKFVDFEKECIEHMDIDYMPLNDIVRAVSGFYHRPTEDEFLTALTYLIRLIEKHHLKVIEGPEMKVTEKKIEDLLDWIKQKWYLGQFDDINYGIWFEK
jgi:hypothetical protein